MCKELKNKIDETVVQIAKFKCLELGINYYSFNNFVDVVWEIQKNEGFRKCFKMAIKCEENCCWKPMCFEDSW